MALTKHELFHLDAIFIEVEETTNLSIEDKTIWMDSKEIVKEKETDYLDEIIKDIEKIKADDKFPDLDSPSDIHDYIEKETKEDFKVSVVSNG